MELELFRSLSDRQFFINILKIIKSLSEEWVKDGLDCCSNGNIRDLEAVQGYTLCRRLGGVIQEGKTLHAIAEP